jgi:hypothetical protein
MLLPVVSDEHDGTISEEDQMLIPVVSDEHVRSNVSPVSSVV